MACSYIMCHADFWICTAAAIAAEPEPVAERQHDQLAQNASLITTSWSLPCRARFCSPP